MTTIRPMIAADLDVVGGMAGELVRLHHTLDEKRFLLVPGVERGYARYFESLFQDPDTVLLVAEVDGRVVGYAFARLEERDWNALRDACGALHDIFVADDQRNRGIAGRLLDRVAATLREKGAPRVVLSTAAGNETAQRFFERHGFRRTMIEMTRELAAEKDP